MLHYLQNLFQAMDFSSLTDAVLRVAAVFLCLTIHERPHGKVHAPPFPEPAAPHRLVRLGADVCGGLWLGEACAGQP